jgi:hypothetical protein
LYAADIPGGLLRLSRALVAALSADAARSAAEGESVMRSRLVPFVVVAVGAMTAVAAAGSPAAHAATTVTDHATEAGVYENTKSWAAHEYDNEGDGDLDIVISDHQKGASLYENDGTGHYIRHANVFPGNPPLSPSRVPDRHDCAPADVDLNGLADFYCSTGRNESNFVKPDYRDSELWLQVAPWTFTEVGTQMGIGDKCGRGRHVTWFDLAPQDGYPDLIFGNGIPRNDRSDPCNVAANGYPSENSKLYRNLGVDENGTFLGFALVQDFGNDDPGQRALEPTDCDLDGDQDIIAARLKSKTPRLFVNGSGRLTLSTSSGLTTATADVTPFDVDGDGREDLVQASRTKVFWQQNLGSCRYGTARTIAGDMTGEWRSVAAGLTPAGVTVYALASADGSNPSDYLFALSGTVWSRSSVPPVSGLGDEAVAVHPTNGDTEFLVLNGGNGGEAGIGGPTQLIQVGVQ